MRDHNPPLPVWYSSLKGKYKPNNIPYTPKCLACQFEIKPGKIPTIQIKHSLCFIKGNEYLSSSNGEEVTICLKLS